MKNRLRYLADNRPIAVLMTSGMLLGIGLLIGLGQVAQALVAQDYSSLVPGYGIIGAGVLSLLAYAIVIISSVRYSPKWMVYGLKTQAGIWLFSALMYLLNGHFLLACIFGIFFSLPAAYTAIHIKYNPTIEHLLRKEA